MDNRLRKFAIIIHSSLSFKGRNINHHNEEQEKIIGQREYEEQERIHPSDNRDTERSCQEGTKLKSHLSPEKSMLNLVT